MSRFKSVPVGASPLSTILLFDVRQRIRKYESHDLSESGEPITKVLQSSGPGSETNKIPFIRILQKKYIITTEWSTMDRRGFLYLLAGGSIGGGGIATAQNNWDVSKTFGSVSDSV